ncbi:MAG: hypothetical protein EZS28_049050, partial [Streblomastix strix]
MNRIQAMFRAL